MLSRLVLMPGVLLWLACGDRPAGVLPEDGTGAGRPPADASPAGSADAFVPTCEVEILAGPEVVDPEAGGAGSIQVAPDGTVRMAYSSPDPNSASFVRYAERTVGVYWQVTTLATQEDYDWEAAFGPDLLVVKDEVHVFWGTGYAVRSENGWSVTPVPYGTDFAYCGARPTLRLGDNAIHLGSCDKGLCYGRGLENYSYTVSSSCVMVFSMEVAAGEVHFLQADQMKAETIYDHFGTSETGLGARSQEFMPYQWCEMVGVGPEGRLEARCDRGSTHLWKDPGAPWEAEPLEWPRPGAVTVDSLGLIHTVFFEEGPDAGLWYAMKAPDGPFQRTFVTEAQPWHTSRVDVLNARDLALDVSEDGVAHVSYFAVDMTQQYIAFRPIGCGTPVSQGGARRP